MKLWKGASNNKLLALPDGNLMADSADCCCNTAPPTVSCSACQESQVPQVLYVGLIGSTFSPRFNITGPCPYEEVKAIDSNGPGTCSWAAEFDEGTCSAPGGGTIDQTRIRWSLIAVFSAGSTTLSLTIRNAATSTNLYGFQKTISGVPCFPIDIPNTSYYTPGALADCCEADNPIAFPPPYTISGLFARVTAPP